MWDDDAVSKNKMVMANVATSLVGKLRRFDESSQTILKVAFCLGSTFSVTATGVVARSLSLVLMGTRDGGDVTEAVSVAKLVDKFEKGRYVGKRKRDNAMPFHPRPSSICSI